MDEQIFTHSLYAAWHSTQKTVQECFAGIEVDEQFILSAQITQMSLPFDDYKKEAILGIDNFYCDSSVFFFPKEDEVTARERIHELIYKWTIFEDDQKTIIWHDEEVGAIWFSLRSTPNGFWVFVYDGSSQPSLSHADLFPDSFFPNMQKSYTNEECSGSDFINSRFREKDPIIELMKAEGIIAADYDPGYDEDEDEDEE